MVTIGVPYWGWPLNGCGACLEAAARYQWMDLRPAGPAKAQGWARFLVRCAYWHYQVKERIPKWCLPCWYWQDSLRSQKGSHQCLRPQRTCKLAPVSPVDNSGLVSPLTKSPRTYQSHVFVVFRLNESASEPFKNRCSVLCSCSFLRYPLLVFKVRYSGGSSLLQDLSETGCMMWSSNSSMCRQNVSSWSFLTVDYYS